AARVPAWQPDLRRSSPAHGSEMLAVKTRSHPRGASGNRFQMHSPLSPQKLESKSRELATVSRGDGGARCCLVPREGGLAQRAGEDIRLRRRLRLRRESRTFCESDRAHFERTTHRASAPWFQLARASATRQTSASFASPV